MLSTKHMYQTTKLAVGVDSLVSELKITMGDGVKFSLSDGNYFYATIRANGVREFVKVVRVSGDTLHTIRAQDNSVGQSFPSGACITVEWNPKQLCEYIHQCVNGDTVEGMSGVVCIDCGTCVTLDGGKITKVDGAQKC